MALGGVAAGKDHEEGDACGLGGTKNHLIPFDDAFRADGEAAEGVLLVDV